MNDVTEKKVKKIQLNRKKKFILLSSSLLITLLVLIIAILCFINYKNNVKKYKTMSLYQYFSGVKYEYTGEVTLTLKDGIIDLKNEDSSKKINFDSLPVYVKGSEHKMILPKTMSVVIPSIKNKNYKISKLTMVKTDFELDNQSYLLYEYDNMYLDKSFLYDGVDTYVFLDNVELVVDDKKINLSPLSYVVAPFRGDIEIYDYKNDKCTIIEDRESEVIVNYDKYVVDLTSDLIEYPDNSFKLLVKSVNKLPLYKNTVTSK